ncbi:membrane hypothetical protein [Pseudomonas veronii]|uniref:hypothetical protein n=1 Tax=Pseudomonas veronii TaxID=76761 RepID=UPI00176F3FC1|nr:hypothetical protein [Pseudomonas veronii]CAD0266032.1 membrane hypothetical protein [Pseudomonas veronii]
MLVSEHMGAAAGGVLGVFLTVILLPAVIFLVWGVKGLAKTFLTWRVMPTLMLYGFALAWLPLMLIWSESPFLSNFIIALACATTGLLIGLMIWLAEAPNNPNR